MIKINLLPYRAERKKEIITRQVFFGAIPLLLTCLIIGILWWSMNSKHEQVSANIASIKVKIKQSKLKMKDIENFKVQKEMLAKKMDIIKTLDKNKTGPVRMLDEIATCLPGNVWLTNLDQKDFGLVLKGRALDNISISRYMTQLESSNSFQGVMLGEIKTDKKISSGGGVRLKAFKLSSKVMYDIEATSTSR
jgi:type IV pilus assembly protein PilN